MRVARVLLMSTLAGFAGLLLAFTQGLHATEIFSDRFTQFAPADPGTVVDQSQKQRWLGTVLEGQTA